MNPLTLLLALIMSAPIDSPKDLLYPLQRKFVDDRSPYKIAVTTRQWGKSTVTAGEAVHDCLTDPGTKWVCMSAGERQSVEWLNKAKEWLAAYQMVITDQLDERDHNLAEGLLRSSEIALANGSRIIAIPANPSTARGYSANVILDEFAYHEDPEAIWAAMFPSTTNALAGTFLDRMRARIKGEDDENIRRHLKLRIVSTFNGRANKFYSLWEKAEENGYSRHKVTIHDAIADGMPLDAEKLRAALDDPDIWAQEYECEPIDGSAILLPYDLIALNESAEATKTVAPEYWEANRPHSRVMGLDFGRKKDLTVAWTAEKLADLRLTREVLELVKMSTPDQFAILKPRMARCARVCLDYTGPGIGLGDLAVKEFGEYNPAAHKFGKVELVTFSNSFKVAAFPTLRAAFEARAWRVPIDRVIREDLHSVHQAVTKTGQLTYRAPHTEDGHADRTTALVLCERAAGSQGPVVLAGAGTSKSRRSRAGSL